MPKKMTVLFLSLIVLVSLIVWGNPSLVGHAAVELTDHEMDSIVGGGWGPCKDCHSNEDVYYECYHTTEQTEPVSCGADNCLTDYHLSSTCSLDPAEGDCSTSLSDYLPGVIQYLRADTNCSSAETYYHVWKMDYYAGDECNCSAQRWRVNCDKLNGICNGTLRGSRDILQKVNCDD